jgi:hypothetical protein
MCAGMSSSRAKKQWRISSSILVCCPTACGDTSSRCVVWGLAAAVVEPNSILWEPAVQL